MDRSFDARALSGNRPTVRVAADTRGRDRFRVDIAGQHDDAAIRALLRDTAFPGVVRLSFEREPDSLAVHVEGDEHGVLVARERSTGRLAAAASRSSRVRYVNGVPMRVGYLGQLRIAQGFLRSRALLDEGFRVCRSLARRDGARIHLASVVAGNTSARRLFERGVPGWPAFRPVDDLVTMAIPARNRYGFGRPRVEVVTGESLDPLEISAVLARNHARHQFAPSWSAHDLSSQPGLMKSDFLVAVRNGGIAGCAALWDQRAFKQVVVRGYSPSVRRSRLLVNAVGPLLGLPALPPVGSRLAFAHLSHIAIDDDDADVAVALVAAARRVARARGLQYVTLGLSSRSAFLAPVRRAFAHRPYASILYVVAWPEGASMMCALDGRPSYPEIAIL